MISLIGGCMRLIFSLVVLVGLAFAAWHYRTPLLELWRDFQGGAATEARGPSPELAAAAEDRLAGMTQRATRAAPVVLSEVEVQSIAEHRLAPFLPDYVLTPAVDLDDGRIRVSARVLTAEFPQVGELAQMATFLPDTADVEATGQLIPLDRDRIGFAVDQLTAERIPLPRRLIPLALSRLGRTPDENLPDDVVALPLPPGADVAYVRGDSLVFLTRAAARGE